MKYLPRKYRITRFVLLAIMLAGSILVQAQQTSEEDALQLPEGMQQQEIDSLIKDWATRNFLTFDDNCETTGENPTFEPEVLAKRLSRLPNVIDMPYNDVVRRYIDQYSGRLRRTVSIMLGASNFYTPIFEEALESYRLPLELKYLPIIESALNPGATSRVGAAGLWQFMIGTGKQYGLEVTSLIDERRDPVKSSLAAARYLKDLYDIFGDWTLVIASYNCGPNNVSKAIKRAGGVTDYWAICPYLPVETRGYVPAFIAANYIMNYYCEHNICPVNTKLPGATDTIVVNRNVDMAKIVATCGIEEENLKALNPQYRTSIIPGEARPCSIRMPSDCIKAFIEAGDSVYMSPDSNIRVVETADTGTPKSSSARKTVTVRNGDTLGSIAKRNHTTVAALRRLNGIKGSAIRAGQKLRVK